MFFDNRGDGTFREVGSLLGLHSRLDGRGAAAADLDDDGDLDLVVVSRNSPTVRVYRNDVVSQGDVLVVDPGPAADSGGAIGAEIEVRCGDRRFLRLVSAGSGFLSQAPARAHVGLGDCPMVDEIAVRVPDKGTRRIPGPFAPNTLVRLSEPQVSARPLRPRNWSRTAATSRGLAGRTLSVPLPELVAEPLGEPIADLGTGTVVLNFWATWCTACAREHEDLLEVAGDPSYAHVRFTAVSLDAVDSGAPDAATLAAWGPRFRHARVGPARQAPFSALVDLAPGAVPLTVLVRDGVARWAHPGALEASDLRAALDAL